MSSMCVAFDNNYRFFDCDHVHDAPTYTYIMYYVSKYVPFAIWYYLTQLKRATVYVYISKGFDQL